MSNTIDEKEKLFELYKIFLAARKRPDAVNGGMTAEDCAWGDALYALNVFEYKYWQRERRIEELRREHVGEYADVK